MTARVKTTHAQITLAGGQDRDTKAVCKRCHVVMEDAESFVPSGEFFHPVTHRDGTRSKCKNAGRSLLMDKDTSEIEPFMRKSERRRNRRHGLRPGARADELRPPRLLRKSRP